jgi:CDP-diacylglycerol--glycerol-3-phosphate 3-phosphatidyltransferase/cardiolipin synthase
MTIERQAWLNIPNAISLLRLPLALLFVLANAQPARVGVVLLAGASDWVDGRIARSAGTRTRLGALLDPLTDKVFMLTVFATLLIEQRVAWWVVALMLVRDIGVAIGALGVLALRRSTRYGARRPGKLVTWLQFLGVLILLLVPSAAPAVAITVALVGLYALEDYRRAMQAVPAS